MAEFAGKVAVVTGRARGMGKAFGKALAAAGAKVVLIDLDGEGAASAARELGTGFTGVAGDVTDNASMEALMGQVSADHGGIDILVNNAGIHSAAANEYFSALGMEKARRMFDVNVWGVLHCSYAARPYMAGRAGAAIVNISSMASYGAQKAYGVSKLAVRGLTMSLAHELAPEGIRVNAVAPGLIMTDTIRAELPPEVIAHVLPMQILRREGEERDVVEAVLYLASGRSSFVTGETLRVSGGATLQV